jgi:hypothetical protein
MTIWYYVLPMSVTEEYALSERKSLPLPFDTLPDLSQISSEAELKKLILALHQDEPPEATQRRVDKAWNVLSHIAREDIVVMPLIQSKKWAVGEITSPYLYEVGAGGEDMHSVDVSWHHTNLAWRRLSLLEGFGRTAFQMAPIEAREEKRAVYSSLKKAYNRFAKFKWLLVLLFALQLISYIIREIESLR